MDSDQKTLNMAVIGTDTLARGARTRITSIQGLGIASSTLTLYDSANAAAVSYTHLTLPTTPYV